MSARPRTGGENRRPPKRFLRSLILATVAVFTLMPLSGSALFSARAASAPAQTFGAAALSQLQAQCAAQGYAALAFQGPTCDVQNHWFTKLRNGTSIEVAPPDSSGLSQQAAAMSAADTAAGTSAVAGATTTACASSSHQRVELVYAHFAGSPDNIASWALDIEQQFLAVDQNVMDYDARSFFAEDAHLYVECNNSGGLVVHDLALSTPIGSASFSTIVSDAQSAGYCVKSGGGGSCNGAGPAHYWIWTDGNPTSGYAGQSSVIGDDSAGASNAINSSDGYSINYGYSNAAGGSGIFAHENGHAMGAVQLSAPDSTGAWHCTDGLDVMCYNDGGPSAGAYTGSDCGSVANGTHFFDCHFNDYFNPAPPAGSYLATHWDIGASYNAWLASAPLQTTATTPGAQLVFWRSAGGDLIEAWYANNLWNPAVDLSTTLGLPPLASAPSATVTPDNSTQLVFFTATNGHIMEIWYAGGRWNGPADLTAAGFGGPPSATPPSVVVLPDGSQQLVFWTASNGHMFEAWWAAGRWNGPIDLSDTFGGPASTSAPDASVAPDGSQQLVFWRGGNAHVYEAWWANARWNGPVDLTALTGGPGTDSPVSVLFTPDESQQLAYWEAGGHMYEAWWANAHWNGPIDITAQLGGAGPVSAPSVAVLPDDSQQLVFWQVGNGDLVEAWWAGARWNGPADLMYSIYAAPTMGSSPSIALAP